jgi:hypothetical protein
LVLMLLALSFSGSCGKSGGEEAPPPIETTLARERAAARFQRFDFAAARQELAPLIAGEAAEAEDLVRAAAVEFALHEPKRATELLDRAEQRGEPSAAAAFLRGRMAMERGDLDRAVRELRLANSRAPADLATKLALAVALQDDGQFEQAEDLYRELVELGLENGETWYLSALYRLQQMLRGMGREEAARPFTEDWKALAERGISPPGEAVLRLGSLGWVQPPPAYGTQTSPALQAPRFEARTLALPALAHARELSAHDLDGDLRMDVLARTDAGVVVALRTEHGWDVQPVLEGAVVLARAFDLDNDLDLDLGVFTAEGPRFLLRGEAAWEPLETRMPELPAPPRDVVAVDFDHDGDLDLLLVGDFGARLWRNDGAWVAGGAFSDATAEAGLPRDRAFSWCLTEDFDGDSDVDLLMGSDAALFLADNMRAGRFADATQRIGAPPRSASRPIIADFDGDGRPDLFLASETPQWWWQQPDGSFRRDAGLDFAPTADAGAFDLDLDGALDIVWPGGALLAAGLQQQRLVDCAGWPREQYATPPCYADFDDDLAVDALVVDGTEVQLLRGLGAVGNALRLRLLGAKDNQRAVGAIVELRAGEIYRRIYYRGEPLIVGVGPHEKLDVFRVRWPNGLVQTALNRDLADQTGDFALDESLGNFAQESGLVGSCPFLYTWNGETYEFITDVLGITPLGLPLAPGQMVPFDHDEYVLVRGEQLAPRAGRLELVVTEELREVTYLDRVRLEVIDHPADTEVFPNERFTFPPFPEPHVHTLRAPLAPLRALGDDGRDWARELAHEDDVHAAPFERQPPQFHGLAKPWSLELSFDHEAVAQAGKLRLVMTGWFDWSDASVNMAAARHPGIDFIPPILSVPDGQGGWRELGPPVGFPAGKTKTMVIELDPLDLAEDARLRLFCTLQLYWDRITLAVDEDDAELHTHSLEPGTARLWQRGFSERIAATSDQPERFDWSRLDPHARWDQHPGLYTRLGECVELLTAIDDRYVIFGAGDALTISFDATALPPVPAGFRRDYLVFFDGWAKDRDPNTLGALEVAPLPFHGMSSYPYPPNEGFPDGELHQRWREEWNTRPARRWIEPLAPMR